MFKKFNWGLSRPFLYSWPILGFKSLRTDYSFFVHLNVLVVKVLEKILFKKFKRFTTNLTLSHILIKHLNTPKYITKNFIQKRITKSKRFGFNKVIPIEKYQQSKKKPKKKFKFKKKKYTKKKRPKYKKKKTIRFLSLKKNNLKNSLAVVEIFYNFRKTKFFNRFNFNSRVTYTDAKFSNPRFTLTKNKKKIKQTKKFNNPKKVEAIAKKLLYLIKRLKARKKNLIYKLKITIKKSKRLILKIRVKKLRTRLKKTKLKLKKQVKPISFGKSRKLSLKLGLLNIFYKNKKKTKKYRKIMRRSLRLLSTKYKNRKFVYRVRSPYLFKMAKKAFSRYLKVPKKLKKKKRLKRRFLKLLRFKIKKFTIKGFFRKRKYRIKKLFRVIFDRKNTKLKPKKKIIKNYNKTKIKNLKLKTLSFLFLFSKKINLKYNFSIFKKIYFLDLFLRKLKWKAFSFKLRKSFSRLNLNILPVFRRISFKDGNSSFYSNYILKELKYLKKPQVFRVIRPLINKLKFNEKIAGLKLIIKGRFTKNQRATKSKIGFGFVPYGSISKKVDYSKRLINAKFGSTSIKLLIKYAV